MNLVYITLINIILLFIFYVILNHKISKNSAYSKLDEYSREVDNLIVELNRAVDDVLNVSEDRIADLKKLVKKAEKLLKEPVVKKFMAQVQPEGENGNDSDKPTMNASNKKSSLLKGDTGKQGHVGEGGGENRTWTGASGEPALSIGKENSFHRPNLVESTRHLKAMGHTKEEIAKILNINKAEIELLDSLYNR
jgi:hypothetical protein